MRTTAPGSSETVSRTVRNTIRRNELPLVSPEWTICRRVSGRVTKHAPTLVLYRTPILPERRRRTPQASLTRVRTARTDIIGYIRLLECYSGASVAVAFRRRSSGHRGRLDYRYSFVTAFSRRLVAVFADELSERYRVAASHRGGRRLVRAGFTVRVIGLAFGSDANDDVRRQFPSVVSSQGVDDEIRPSWRRFTMSVPTRRPTRQFCVWRTALARPLDVTGRYRRTPPSLAGRATCYTPLYDARHAGGR